MRILLPSQEQQLLSVIRPGEPFGPRDRALIVFALHTGLRSHELCSLNVGHVMTWDGFPASGSRWWGKAGSSARSRSMPWPVRRSLSWCTLIGPAVLRWPVSRHCWSPGATVGFPLARCGTSCSGIGSGRTLMFAVLLTRYAIPLRPGWLSRRVCRWFRPCWDTAGSRPLRSTPAPRRPSWRPGWSAWRTVSPGGPARSGGLVGLPL